MSTVTNIRQDNTLLSRSDRALDHVERFLTLLGGWSILIAMLISVANILGRKLFNIPVPGYVAIMQQLVPMMAFLGLSWCQRLGGHIRMDLLVGNLRGRTLWVAEFLGVSLMLILSVALIYGSYFHAERAFSLGDSTDDLNIPTWPVKMIVPIMLSVLSLRLILQIWGYGRAIRTGDDEPVAVPLIEDAATQAAHEAETVSGADT